MPFFVRSATPADRDIIVEFNRLLALESENVTLDTAILSPGVAAVLSDPHRGRYFVADENGQVIGQMMITYEWSDWRNGWIWWLQSVYVRQDRRRAGVFRALFHHVQDQAKKAGNVAGLRLYVERENHSAQKTYESLGFEEMHFHLYQRMDSSS